MRVERQVVRDEAQVGVEEGAQALPHDLADATRILVPEEPVVDENHLRVRLGRALEQLPRGRDPADELLHLRRPHHLSPIGP